MHREIIDPSVADDFFSTLLGHRRLKSGDLCCYHNGHVFSDNIGGIFVDFDNTPRVFTFNDSSCEPDPTGGLPGQQTTCGIGSFAFSVNDFSVDPGSIVPLTGQVTSAQQTAVPEPATLFLLGTGLTGIVAKLRRRRRAKSETGN